MNFHFISFVFDIFSWTAFSLLLSYFITQLEHPTNKKVAKNSFILLFVALCSGCWSVITHGLPDIGFSWFSFISVVFVTYIVSLVLSPGLRLKSKDLFIIILGYLSLRIKEKGGVTYGNSR